MPGILDRHDRNPADGYDSTDCIIGSELLYPAADGLPAHSDPEGKSGQILAGTAYDGVRVSADLAVASNTTDGLLPPAYVQETRSGPILPVLAAAPTTGPYDLDVAWYRPDTRKVAWPVKAAGYRCQWPKNAAEDRRRQRTRVRNRRPGGAELDSLPQPDGLQPGEPSLAGLQPELSSTRCWRPPTWAPQRRRCTRCAPTWRPALRAAAAPRSPCLSIRMRRRAIAPSSPPTRSC